MQLSAARVDQLAKRFEGKVETEDELEAKLSDFNDLFPLADIARDDDRQRSLQSEITKLKEGKGEAGADPANTTSDDTPPKDEDQPAWVKALLETQNTLMTEISALKTGKVANDRKASILSKLDGADEKYSSKVVRDFGRMKFESDEEFEEYLNDVEDDFKAYQQTIAEGKLGNDQPFSGVGGVKLKDDEVSPFMQGFLDSNAPSDEK